MALFLRKRGSSFEMELFLQGGVIGGRQIATGKKDLYVHGLTLITTGAFAGTITFAATPTGAQSPLSVQEVLDQIETQSAGALVPGIYDKRLYLRDAGVPSVAVSVSSTGTANTALGFDDANNTAGKFYNSPSGAVPRYVELHAVESSQGSWVIVTEET